MTSEESARSLLAGLATPEELDHVVAKFRRDGLLHGARVAMRDVLLRVLRARFGHVSDAAVATIYRARRDTLRYWIQRSVRATSVVDLLAGPREPRRPSFGGDLWQEGAELGLESARRDALVSLLNDRFSIRFGEFPVEVAARIDAAGRGQLETWIDRVLVAGTLDEVMSTVPSSPPVLWPEAEEAELAPEVTEVH